MPNLKQPALNNPYRKLESAPKVKSRRIGFVEAAITVEDEISKGASNMGGRMSLTGEIDIEKFKNAVALLIKNHPLLHSKLDFRARPPTVHLQDIEEKSSLPLTIVTEEKDDFGTTHLEKTIDQPFDLSKSPLWELTLATNKNKAGPHSVILKAHHLVCDGTSVAILMQTLLSYYNQPKVVATPLPFLQPAEDLVPHSISFARYLLNHIFLEISSMFHKLGGILHLATPVTHRSYNLFTPKRQTKLTLTQFDKSDREHLLSACQKNNITLDALLTAVLLKSVRETLSPLAIETISTPVDVRPLFSNEVPKGDHIGCYMASANLNISINKNMSVWDIAKTYSKELPNNLPVIYPKHFNADRWQLYLLKDAMRGDQAHFKDGISVYNLKNTISDQATDAPLKLVDMHFCSSRVLGEKVMQLCTVTAAGNLNLSFSHPEPLLSKEQADRIKENTLLMLRSIIQQEKEFVPQLESKSLKA